MGHQERVPHPSPLQMLAIFRAKASGVRCSELKARTGHSRTTIDRWWSKWGQDAKTFDNMLREYRVPSKGFELDDVYPPPVSDLSAGELATRQSLRPIYKFKIGHNRHA